VATQERIACLACGHTGQGDQARQGNETSQSAIADWLVVRGQEPGTLFVPVTRGSKAAKVKAAELLHVPYNCK
jgi:hypothetical protein